MKTEPKYIILGILTTDCRTGYEIKKLMDQSFQHFWKLSYGQIYPTLKKIVQEGLAEAHDIQQEGAPNRKEYHLTELGREELHQWLHAPVEELATHRNELLAKLFFARHLPTSVTIQHLQQYEERLKAQREVYQNMKKGLYASESEKADVDYWVFTLNCGIKTTSAAIDWCAETIELLERGGH
ncbi:PadR family transcriptional regulator [Salicibibacter cibi]|uniref:PadR family transcriptional regulator n=1 Tax=Salicibibacter cibi TaxID=2743001 RepID=A0A7T7CEN7_9BACI|nr:PadR family transcriptional regulator [Salicibibacter cibi]QQK79248.1 PadR family transcriptional regulator [Salicibibacter cibi]